MQKIRSIFRHTLETSHLILIFYLNIFLIRQLGHVNKTKKKNNKKMFTRFKVKKEEKKMKQKNILQ